jgi:hypothetical protein
LTHESVTALTRSSRSRSRSPAPACTRRR